MNTEVNPYSITWTKMMSPLKEWWIGKPPGLFTIFFKTSKWYLKFMHFKQLF